MRDEYTNTEEYLHTSLTGAFRPVAKNRLQYSLMRAAVGPPARDLTALSTQDSYPSANLVELEKTI